MTELQAPFLSALAMTIAFCAVPGAVTAEALRRGLLRGYRPVLAFQVGALAGGTVWVVLSLAGAAVIAELVSVRLVLALGGALLMLRMAAHALVQTRRGGVPTAENSSPSGDLASGVLMGLADPFAVVFWLGLAAELSPVDSGTLRLVQMAAVLAAFVVGSLVYRVGFAALAAWGRRFLSAITFRYLNFASAVVLVYFSLRLVASAVPLVASW